MYWLITQWTKQAQEQGIEFSEYSNVSVGMWPTDCERALSHGNGALVTPIGPCFSKQFYPQPFVVISTEVLHVMFYKDIGLYS